MDVRTNLDALVAFSLLGEAIPPSIPGGLYEVTHDGRPVVLPSVGGIALNVRVGMPVGAFVADHIEPGVSIRHPEDRANTSLNVFSCVSNIATVWTGEAKGARGVVTGKHGGVENVIVDFPTRVMEQLALGDKIVVRGQGVGLELLDAPEVRAFNLGPDLLEHWGLRVDHGTVHAPVAAIVPARIMGSGLGRDTVVRGDYDIQLFDDATVEEFGLRNLRLGDIVAIKDADHSYGRIYRTGAMSVGVISHGASHIAGHGPGVTTLLTSRTGRIVPHVTPEANLKTILALPD